MQHFVRYARFSFSGTLLKPGWRIRLFAAPAAARAFAEQLIVENWRVETGSYDGAPADAGALESERAEQPSHALSAAPIREKLAGA